MDEYSVEWTESWTGTPPPTNRPAAAPDSLGEARLEAVRQDVDPVTFGLAREFVVLMRRHLGRSAVGPRIAATDDRMVSFEWEYGTRELLLELRRDGTLECLLVEAGTDRFEGEKPEVCPATEGLARWLLQGGPVP